ncbi:asparagine synthase (glutamine-hydrolysing) [Amphibacillus marinus]|uniref:asparagine synthase (glutamine-hydrolyzing) n=1 Tax=Amphibacillus marinus TaxID=872970 RepID=A0A1H8S1L5_9BACI|nr:asparagine synthase (glutamine-hydrolyzing) [Amphibacillus marinus]SEO72550.1 asparagine synthase (glutamine-hydrolysing) [Amphibacillus marinus]
MCGFFGFLQYNQEKIINKDKEALYLGTERITHRGPDDSGYYEDQFVSLGFRRLSIIDLENGHQPFVSQDQRYVMVFNGEVYNYIELREQLIADGFNFQTDSDTEVVLQAFIKHREQAFKMLRGMFAILIWDTEEQEIFAARDPFGIKPLYYKREAEALTFASELKSFNGEELFTFNEQALQQYLSFQYVPEPSTLNEQICKLEPGHFIKQTVAGHFEVNCYWKATFRPIQSDFSKLVTRVQESIIESVGIHMRSDVPVGSFLSGGIDSSFIVAAAKQFNPKIKTFSVGFERDGFSEIDVASQTAEKLNVENFAKIITAEQYMKELPRIIWYLDDPLADPASIPLYFVAEEARKQVKVVLSGEGADELFGGYNIYREPESLRHFNYLPERLKRMLNYLAKMMPEGVKGKSFIERGTTPLAERYIGNAKMFEGSALEKVLKKYRADLDFQAITKPYFEEAGSMHAVNQMQYIDLHTWLRGDILLKADRMTMAHSLELRVPFLDKKVFDLAMEIPVEYKIANGTTKYVLREAAKGIVPDHVIDRKKLGFPVPIRHWLKDEMYDWAKAIIMEGSTEHLINHQYVLSLLEMHREGKQDYSRKIWTVLVFMIWYQINVEQQGIKQISQLAQ